MQSIETEARAVLALCKPGRHPNILGVFRQGAFLDSVFPGYFFDMELCDINLERYMSQHCQESEAPIAIVEIWDIMMQLTAGTAFIHQHGKVHRDLKPRNGINSLELLRLLLILVLLSDQSHSWKIADFGLTMEATSKGFHTTEFARGSVGYRAPELINDERHYNNKSDIWSLGCILHELATEQKAFTTDLKLLSYAISDPKSRQICPPINNSIDETSSRYLKDIINEMLEIDASIRPSAVYLSDLFARYHDKALQFANSLGYIDSDINESSSNSQARVGSKISDSLLSPKLKILGSGSNSESQLVSLRTAVDEHFEIIRDNYSMEDAENKELDVDESSDMNSVTISPELRKMPMEDEIEPRPSTAYQQTLSEQYYPSGMYTASQVNTDPLQTTEFPVSPTSDIILGESSPLYTRPRDTQYRAFPRIPPIDTNVAAVMSTTIGSLEYERETEIDSQRDIAVRTRDPATALAWAEKVYRYVSISMEEIRRERAAVIVDGGVAARPATPTYERGLRDDCVQIVEKFAKLQHPKAV